MPVCAVSGAPMRSIAIITISTGATVHTIALSSDSQITWRRHVGRRQRTQQQELHDAQHAGHAGGQAGQAQRAEALDFLAAVDQVQRIAHRAAEHQRRAERDVSGRRACTSWPNTSATPT